MSRLARERDEVARRGYEQVQRVQADLHAEATRLVQQRDQAEAHARAAEERETKRIRDADEREKQRCLLEEAIQRDRLTMGPEREPQRHQLEEAIKRERQLDQAANAPSPAGAAAVSPVAAAASATAYALSPYAAAAAASATAYAPSPYAAAAAASATAYAPSPYAAAAFAPPPFGAVAPVYRPNRIPYWGAPGGVPAALLQPPVPMQAEASMPSVETPRTQRIREIQTELDILQETTKSRTGGTTSSMSVSRSSQAAHNQSQQAQSQSRLAMAAGMPSFDEIDRNGDGVIDKQEWLAATSQSLPQTRTPAQNRQAATTVTSTVTSTVSGIGRPSLVEQLRAEQLQTAERRER